VSIQSMIMIADPVTPPSAPTHPKMASLHPPMIAEPPSPAASHPTPHGYIEPCARSARARRPARISNVPASARGEGHGCAQTTRLRLRREREMIAGASRVALAHVPVTAVLQMFNEPGYEEMRGKPETEARSQQMKAEIQLWTIRQGITAALCRQCDPRGSVGSSMHRSRWAWELCAVQTIPGADPSSGHRARMLPVLRMALLYYKRGASARAGAAQRRSDGLRCFSAPVGASAPRRALISTIPHDRLLPGMAKARTGPTTGCSAYGT
jgi:hypothetical protein